jgi:hypothetical protein
MRAKHMIDRIGDGYWAFFETGAPYTSLMVLSDDIMDQILKCEGYELRKTDHSMRRGEWVSTCDMLPQVHTTVLALRNDGVMETMWYDSVSHTFRNEALVSKCVHGIPDISHWMYLPKRPEEKTE